MIEIRREKSGDEESIRRVTEAAFGGPDAARIVDALRTNCGDLLSLVAANGEEVVGHILFSPAALAGVQGMGSAPMAVRPERQRQGIGSRLVRAGISQLETRRCPFVIVLGHPEYDPRFGFERASRHGVHGKWRVPDEAVMLLVLDPTATEGVSGVARYRSELG